MFLDFFAFIIHHIDHLRTCGTAHAVLGLITYPLLLHPITTGENGVHTFISSPLLLLSSHLRLFIGPPAS